MLENGHIASRSPTNDEVRKLDDLQAQLHEGPCITAVEFPPEDGVVVAQELTGPPDVELWPHSAPQAVAHGYRSLLSTQLSTNGGTRSVPPTTPTSNSSTSHAGSPKPASTPSTTSVAVDFSHGARPGAESPFRAIDATHPPAVRNTIG
jgi:hypothetical protein